MDAERMENWLGAERGLSFMSDVRTVACDVCGVQKGEANHWWQAAVSPNGKVISIFRFGQMTVSTGRRLDFCGEAHLLQRLSALMKRVAIEAHIENLRESPELLKEEMTSGTIGFFGATLPR